MKPRFTWPNRVAAAVIASATILALTGCQHWKQYYSRPPAQPLGALIDPVWQMQERNAEMSDFVVHLHEWREHDSEFLNNSGEEHVKSIAARLKKGQDAFVIVERSKHTARPDTKYKFPVHTNPELDLRRREMIVRLLGAMGPLVRVWRTDHESRSPDALDRFASCRVDQALEHGRLQRVDLTYTGCFQE